MSLLFLLVAFLGLIIAAAIVSVRRSADSDVPADGFASYNDGGVVRSRPDVTGSGRSANFDTQDHPPQDY